MTRGSTIFCVVSRCGVFWEKYESWLWSRPDNAMARALAFYPFDTALNDALDTMTTAEMAVIEAHEQGEYHAGLDLGEAWEAMLLDISLTPAELMARACAITWPTARTPCPCCWRRDVSHHCTCSSPTWGDAQAVVPVGRHRLPGLGGCRRWCGIPRSHAARSRPLARTRATVARVARRIP